MTRDRRPPALRSGLAVLRRLGSGVVQLAAPDRCLACRRRAVPPWCADCADEVRVLAPGCQRCGSPKGIPHCCWPGDASIAGTRVVYDYQGPLAAALRAAKLSGAHAAWPVLAAPLARRLMEPPVDVDVATWVTTPPGRARRRAGDHARCLAESCAARLGLPVLRLLDARPRRDGRGDVYRFVPVWRLPGSRVLLFDDVLTTGATAERAASVLRDAGAGEVVLAVLARAGTHPLTGR